MSRARHRGRVNSVWRGPLPLVAAGVLIAAFVGWSYLSSRATPAPSATAGEAAVVAAAATGVPADVLDRVGAGSASAHLTRTQLPLLKGTSGRPLVVYVGADFCPFCASERWSLVVALSRFGTFRDLGLTRSSSSDVFPDTATFSFRGSAYASDLVEFSSVETADRAGAPQERPDAVQQAAMDRSDPRGAIPFVSIADRYVGVGSGYSPDVLRGKTWMEIAEQLRDPASPVARAALGNANRITAAICEVTAGAPAAVCASPAVKGLGPSK